MRRALAPWWPWAGLVGRLVVGGVWIAAGLLKLPDPAESIRAVRAYRLLPEAIVPMVGYGLPPLEIAVGVLLVLGIGVRVVAALSALMQLAFLIGISSAWARGLQIDCGCFGGGGTVAAADTHYGSELARDSALFLISVALMIWPRTRLALSTMILGTPAPDEALYDSESDTDTDTDTDTDGDADGDAVRARNLGQHQLSDDAAEVGHRTPVHRDEPLHGRSSDR